jgi:hypothetical protein
MCITSHACYPDHPHTSSAFKQQRFSVGAASAWSTSGPASAPCASEGPACPNYNYTWCFNLTWAMACALTALHAALGRGGERQVGRPRLPRAPASLPLSAPRQRRLHSVADAISTLDRQGTHRAPRPCPQVPFDVPSGLLNQRIGRERRRICGARHSHVAACCAPLHLDTLRFWTEIIGGSVVCWTRDTAGATSCRPGR